MPSHYGNPFIEMLLGGRKPTPTDFLSPLNGLPAGSTPAFNPSAPDPRTQSQKPGVMGKLDSFIGTQGGGLLMNLLAQSGYSTMPQSPFGAIGRATLANQEQQTQRARGGLEDEFLRSQIGLNQARAQNPYQNQSKPPASIAEYNLYSQQAIAAGQDPMSFEGWMEKLGPGMLIQMPDGSVQMVRPRSSSTPSQVVTPEQARDSTIASTTNTEQAKAVTELPTAATKAETVLNVLDQIENHEGFSGAVGFKGAAQGFGTRDEPFAGTPEADFVALVDQAGGAVFLEAFQDLKGGGHITEIEGEKAEKAVARIRNRNQSEIGYKNAITELREIIKKGLDSKKMAAKGDFSVPEGKVKDSSVLQYDAQGKRIQ